MFVGITFTGLFSVMYATISASVAAWRGQFTVSSLSGVPDYFGRNKISSGGDLSHYSSASLY